MLGFKAQDKLFL